MFNLTSHWYEQLQGFKDCLLAKINIYGAFTRSNRRN